MKITISDINIDVTTPEFEDCFNLKDVLHVAVNNVERSLKGELQQALRYEVLSDATVKKFLEGKKVRILQVIEEAMEDM